MRANVFDIKNYAIHDGPGIRTTVFFMGCTLHCAWCQNPESIVNKQRILFDPVRCIGCGRCADGCSALSEDGRRYLSRCISCWRCVRGCPSKALRLLFKSYTVEELSKLLIQDKIFFDVSGGGVTCSGGECMLWSDYILQLFQRLKKEEIHTTIDTCGNVPFEEFEKILPWTDLFLYDVKIISREMHVRYTGKDNVQILENLKRLRAHTENIIIRIPLIPGVTDTEENLKGIAVFLQKNIGKTQVNLLQYNTLAESKYEKPSFFEDEKKEFYFCKGLKAQSKEDLEEKGKWIEAYGHHVKLLYQ